MHELSDTISSLANLFSDSKEFFPSAPKDVAEMVLVLKSVLDKHSVKFGTMESEISVAHDKVKQA